MLQRLDRILVAVRDRSVATDTFGAVLAARRVRDDRSAVLGAHRSVMQAGCTEIELLQPDGPGPVRDFIARWGEGLLGVGFTTADLAALRDHLSTRGVRCSEEAGQLHLGPDQTHGARVVLSPGSARTPVGLISHIYEVTNLVADWQRAAARYADLFGLDASRFHQLTSAEFGYSGTLTLFNPPAQLDRIELSQTTDPVKAMGRFFAKRGENLYMCYAETDDLSPIVRRLDERGMRWAGSRDTAQRENLFIHPSGLHGVLMGVSRTNLAWTWSGHPELAARA
jgi:hypothetical protein